MNERSKNILLIFCSVILTVITFEILFRLALYNFGVVAFSDTIFNSIYYYSYNKVPTLFHEKYGYSRPPNETIERAIIRSGRPILCHKFSTNENGNHQRLHSHENANLKRVFVFGDSFTEGTHTQNITWPDFLEDELTQSLGIPIHVENYGRSGYGVLQILELAADTTFELKPDLVIIAIIVNDLRRARFWADSQRSPYGMRYITLLQSTENNQLYEHSERGFIDNGVSVDWCNSLARSGATDDTLSRMNRRFMDQAIARRDETNFWRLRPFIFDALVESDTNPLSILIGRNNPSVKFHTYREDERVMRSIEKLNNSGVPYVTILLPMMRDLNKGEYILDQQERDLATSLEPELEGGIIRIMDQMVYDPDNIETLFFWPKDSHPAVAGLKAYAKAVAGVTHGKKNLGLNSW